MVSSNNMATIDQVEGDIPLSMSRFYRFTYNHNGDSVICTINREGEFVSTDKRYISSNMFDKGELELFGEEEQLSGTSINLTYQQETIEESILHLLDMDTAYSVYLAHELLMGLRDVTDNFICSDGLEGEVAQAWNKKHNTS